MIRTGTVLLAVILQATAEASPPAEASPLDSVAFQALMLGVAAVVLRAFGDDIVKVSHSVADAIPKRLESAQKGQDAQLDSYDKLVKQNELLFGVIATRDEAIAKRDAAIDARDGQLQQFSAALLEANGISKDLRDQLDREREERAQKEKIMTEQANTQTIAMKALADRNDELERRIKQLETENQQLRDQLEIEQGKKSDSSPAVAIPPVKSDSPAQSASAL